MFEQIKRTYNLKRDKIWRGIAIIVVGLIVIKIIDNALYNKKLADDANQQIVNIQTGYAVASETIVDEEVREKTQEIIDSFINYCNEGQAEQAYMLLSDKCKEKTYPTLEIFRDVFVKNNFETKKEYSINAWMFNTYRVKIFDDMLATGLSTTNHFTTENYMTIAMQGEEVKLNINGYVNTTEIDEEVVEDGLTIKAIEKDVYVDNETYKFEVTNKTGQSIKLDTKEKISSVNIKNLNGVIYPSYIGEKNDEDLIFENGETRQIEIKFNNNYKTQNYITEINFQKIQKDLNDKTDTMSLTINLE